MAKAANLKSSSPPGGSARRAANDAGEANGGIEVKTVVKPVANAVAILRYLGQSNGPHTATHIAKVLGINTSTCFNILRTLVGEGVVDFDRVGKTYSIGFGLAKLIKTIPLNDHIQASRPFIHDLAEDYGLTICLWHRVGDRITSVLVEPTVADLRIHLRLGQRLPVLLGSTGRILATRLGLTKRELRSKFSQLRWATPISFEQYWKEAQDAEARGYAVDDGNFSAGVMTVSTPVFGPSGEVEYTLTGLTFRGKLDEAGQARFGRDLIALSQRLSEIIY
jgi:DNA-binding IclR family transcriptional regulator